MSIKPLNSYAGFKSYNGNLIDQYDTSTLNFNNRILSQGWTSNDEFNVIGQLTAQYTSISCTLTSEALTISNLGVGPSIVANSDIKSDKIIYANVSDASEGGFREKSTAPGIWLEESGMSGAFMVLNAGVFQLQRRSPNWGGYELQLYRIDLDTGDMYINGKLAVNDPGGTDNLRIGGSIYNTGHFISHSIESSRFFQNAGGTYNGNITFDYSDRYPQIAWRTGNIATASILSDTRDGHLYIDVSAGKNIYLRNGISGPIFFTANSLGLTSTVPYIAPASTTSNASIRLPSGTAPTSANVGDMWTTTSGLFARINSNTYNLIDKVTEAPNDGTIYARQNNSWVAITSGGGSSVSTQQLSAYTLLSVTNAISSTLYSLIQSSSGQGSIVGIDICAARTFYANTGGTGEGGFRERGSAPGFWLEESGMSGAYTVLNAGYLQLQRRKTGWGAFDTQIYRIDLATSDMFVNGKFAVNDPGGTDNLRIGGSIYNTGAIISHGTATSRLFRNTGGTYSGNITFDYADRYPQITWRSGNIGKIAILGDVQQGHLYIDISAGKNIYFRDGLSGSTFFTANATGLTSTSPYIAPAATTSKTSIRIPHGTAPSSLTNGDMWSTTSGLFARINSVTYNLTQGVTGSFDLSTYTPLTTTELLTSNLQSQINSEIVDRYASDAIISGGLGIYALNSYVQSTSAALQSQIFNRITYGEVAGLTGRGSTTAISSINGLSSQSLIISGVGSVSVFNLNSNTIIISGGAISQSASTNVSLSGSNGIIVTSYGNNSFLISISGQQSSIYGVVNCVTSQNVYSVSHSVVNANEYPVTSLIVPSISSELTILGITNKTSSGFDIVLSGLPQENGYKISWVIASSILGGSGSSSITITGGMTSGEIRGLTAQLTPLVTTNQLTANLQSQITLLKNRVIRLNVKDFGARGDGTTDDSSAIYTAFQTLLNEEMRFPPSITGSYIPPYPTARPDVRFYFPSGDYLIRQPNLLMNNFSTKGAGLIMEGDGQEATTIYFCPSASSYLINIDDIGDTKGWLHCTFRDMSFQGNSSYANFWQSRSNGSIQGMKFDNISWNGFDNVFSLIGTDTNSEWSWKNCRCTGKINKFLYIPDVSGSDQFLNFWWSDFIFHTDNGTIVDASKGGCFMFDSGSWIHTAATSAAYISGAPTEGYFFLKLNDIGHASSTMNCFVRSTRVEHRSIYSKLIYSEWNSGAISFENCSMDALVWAISAFSTAFIRIPYSCPNIAFRSCSIHGYHSYQYTVQSYKGNPCIEYDNCYFASLEDPKDFVETIPDPITSANFGGEPVISFKKCRLSNYEAGIPGLYVCDYNRNWHQKRNGIGERKIVHITDAYNTSPDAGAYSDVILPPNSVVTKIIQTCPAGALTAFTEGGYEVINGNGKILNIVYVPHLYDGWHQVTEPWENVG
jgi:hypothetical protein